MEPTPNPPTSLGLTLDEDGTYGWKAILHQRLLKWLRTILALVMVSFPILKYRETLSTK